MAEQIIIQVRVDRELKEQAAEVFDELGIDVPTAVRMFLKTVVREQGLPFGTSVGRTNKDTKKMRKAPAKPVSNEKLMNILNDINPDIDYESCNTLIDDGALDSLQVLSLIMRIEEEFHISIDPSEVAAEELNSVASIIKMIEKHQ